MSRKTHEASCCLPSTILRFGTPLLTVSLRNILSSRRQRGQPSFLPSLPPLLSSPSPLTGQHLHLPLFDGTRVLLLLHGGFRAILLFSAKKRRHCWGTGIRKGCRLRTDLCQGLLPPLPSGTRGRSRPRAQPHSQALIPQADHALHDRELPRLLLLPLQGQDTQPR